jgi:LPXTG-motif cell wall-anchored protein
MKRSVLLFSVTALLLFGSLNMASAQDNPAPKKDTVNMDTDAKPQFYYAVEDEKTQGGTDKGSGKTIAIIIGVVVVVGGTGFYFVKKKKQ